MKEFRLFDISDFVMDEDFIRWVNKKEKADNDFWNNWLRQHPDKHMVVAEARRILESIGTEQQAISELEIDNEIVKLMSIIRVQAETPKIQSRPLTLFKKWSYAAAATLLIAMAGTAVYFLKQNRTSAKKFSYEVVTPAKGLIENANTSEKSMTVKLPDGSTAS